VTELIWHGKYDQDHQRNPPVRIALPFQTVETVNQSALARAHQGEALTQGQPNDWRNRLIWGDNAYVLPSLLHDPEVAGKVNLIYIDPPFATGADFSRTTLIPEEDGATLGKTPGAIEQTAYRDTWGRGLDRYLHWFAETITLLRDLLADDGALLVHLDWRVGHYAKVILDELFGPQNFRNDISWAYRSGGASRKESLPRKHDSILFYAKSPAFVVRPHTERQYLDKPFMGSKTDPQGRHYVDTLLRDVLEGEIVVVRDADTISYNVRPVLNLSHERLDYPSQKPIGLLTLLLQIASDEGELVLDCFCGSGTTAAAAEATGRRWITCDLSRFAIHTTRKRLLSNVNVRPFEVQNLGRYERQAWQAAEFAEGDARAVAQTQAAYRRFILDLYHAQPLNGYVWLHGLRDGRLVHVGAVDAPVAEGDVRQIVGEFQRVAGERSAAGQATDGVDALGWDFAFDVHEMAARYADETGVSVRFKGIPREALEKRAVEQGKIRFYELAALTMRLHQHGDDDGAAPEQPGGSHVTITLSDYIISADDAPDDARRAVKRWEQWIDWWAVDWDYQGGAFHIMAHCQRTRKAPMLQTCLSHTYEKSGSYTVMVKVIDILGNETSKAHTVEVGFLPHGGGA